MLTVKSRGIDMKQLRVATIWLYNNMFQLFIQFQLNIIYFYFVSVSYD